MRNIVSVLKKKSRISKNLKCTIEHFKKPVPLFQNSLWKNEASSTYSLIYRVIQKIHLHTIVCDTVYLNFLFCCIISLYEKKENS